MSIVTESVINRMRLWLEAFNASPVVKSAINWFYHWLGTFNVSLAFIFFIMFLLTGYMMFRCLRRMRFPALLSLLLQLMLLTMVSLILVDKVLVIPAYEILFIAGGILLPSGFLLRDYIGMKRRVRVSCGPVFLIEKLERKSFIVSDEDWTLTPDMPGALYPADRVGRNLKSSDASILSKAREQLREADGMIAENKWDEANGIYTFLARIIPLDAAGLCNAGWLRYRFGSQDEAVRLFKRALAMSGKTEEKTGSTARNQPAWVARFGLGCARFAMESIDQALFDFQKASVADGNSAALLRNMARCHLLLDRPERAREELEKSLDLEDSPDARLALARLLLQLSLREGALAQLERLTLTERDMSAAWRALGTLYWNEEKWGKAQPCFEQLARLEPDNPDAWFRLGACHQHLGHPDEAYTAFRSAIGLMPDHSRALACAATILVEKKEGKEAISCLRQSLAGNEPLAETYILLAELYRDEGRIPEAVAAYEESVSKFPESGLLQANLGAILVTAGLHDRAPKPLKAAIRHGRNDPSNYTLWVNALLETKHEHEAVRISREAMAAHPEDMGLRYLSARAKARCHDTEGAIRDLEAVVAGNPEMRLEARSCADFATIRTAPGYIGLIRLPMKTGK